MVTKKPTYRSDSNNVMATRKKEMMEMVMLCLLCQAHIKMDGVFFPEYRCNWETQSAIGRGMASEEC